MNRLVIILVLPLFLSVNNNPEEILDNANRSYIAGRYEEAFSHINMYVKSIGENSLSHRAQVLGEKIYYFYLQSLIISNSEDLELVKDVIDLNRYFFSSRINSIVSKENNPNKKSNISNSNNYEDTNLEKLFEATKDLSEEELTILLKESLKGEKSKSLSKGTITVSILLAVVVITLIVLSTIFVSSKKRKSFAGSLIRPKAAISDENEEFIKKSLGYGLEIDKVTGRRNNSQNTGELIYKISIKNGLSEDESYLNYIVSHIYDIGLLKVDRSLLKKSKLNDDEFKKIKEHVSLGLGMIDFVPEEYVHKVYDCIISHHENLDGSGYPNGVQKISFLARAVRVVEAYLSQVSSREYNLIKDKEVAINHLRSELDIIDQDIVELLFEVV